MSLGRRAASSGRGSVSLSLGYLTEISGDAPWWCRAGQGFGWGNRVAVCVIGVSCSHEISDVISCCGTWRGKVPA